MKEGERIKILFKHLASSKGLKRLVRSRVFVLILARFIKVES